MMLLLASTLSTHHGDWNAIVLLLVLLCTGAVALWIRRHGRKDFRTEGHAQKPFVSGNQVDNPEDVHLGASNLYWGFLEAMKGYYKIIRPLHSGILSDYILWFLISLVVFWGVWRWI